MLETVKTQMTVVLSNKKFLMVLFCTIIFIAVAIYIYRKQVVPKLNPDYVPNKEYINKDDETPEIADLYFFYTTWCPHCKTAMPAWNNFKEQVGETKINGVKINFYEIDCEKDTALAEQYNVEGYPTIKLSHGNKVITYDAKPDVDTLNQFLKTSL